MQSQGVSLTLNHGAPGFDGYGCTLTYPGGTATFAISTQNAPHVLAQIELDDARALNVARTISTKLLAPNLKKAVVGGTLYSVIEL